MDEKLIYAPLEVGRRIKERRTELKLSMPELGRRINVNKSTIQRYETEGVDPKRTMVINGLADALRTTPEWLKGLSDEKDLDEYALQQAALDRHVRNYLDTVSSSLVEEEYQEKLDEMLGKLIDLYIELYRHFVSAVAAANQAAEDESLRQSLMRYDIEPGAIAGKVYRKEMEQSVEEMKRFLSGIYDLYDEKKNSK